MKKERDLLEQHVRESESRLMHIDELMKRARQAYEVVPVSPTVDLALSGIQSERDRLAQVLAQMQGKPAGEWPDLATRPHGLEGALGVVGTELEKVLASIVFGPKSDRR